jgi:hypothetical protein
MNYNELSRLFLLKMFKPDTNISVTEMFDFNEQTTDADTNRLISIKKVFLFFMATDKQTKYL